MNEFIKLLCIELRSDWADGRDFIKLLVTKLLSELAEWKNRMLGNTRIAELEAERDGLYDNVRLSEDVGVEEGMFDEDERRTGPNGWDVENETRWQAKHTS